MGSHQATLEEDVTLLTGQTSSSLTGRTSGLPRGQLLMEPEDGRSRRAISLCTVPPHIVQIL
jgi:hypothetical protein